MKNLIAIAAMVLASQAGAGVIASQPNDEGGRIVLTDESLKDCKGNHAYSYSASGRMVHGCWSYVDSIKAARIAWDDGTVRMYPSNTFQLSPYGVERYIRPGLDKQGPPI